MLPEAPLELLDELPCPVCARVMRVARRHGVAIDVCERHGVWLDRGELERLLARRLSPAASSGLRVRLRRTRTELRRTRALAWVALLT
jgi:Zn-finger nucleic acid-binding protein